MSVVIGIDLGTTNSLCAVFENGRPRLIPNAHGHFLTPSVVCVLEDDRVIVGQPAKDLRVTKPDRCVSRFKRLMGTSEKTQLGAHQFTAPELSSLILKSLKRDAEADLGLSIDKAVITVPAYFNDHQRRATKLAGELAGLEVLRIINEPTAAALTYGFHDKNAEKNLLVIDLGGGTFDVTLMEVFEGTLEIRATSGESMLGGEDFTDRLVATVLQKHGMQLETVELKHPLMIARLRQSCEAAKVAFADQTSIPIAIPNSDGLINSDCVSVSIHREEFLIAMKPMLERLLGPIQKVLRDADIRPGNVNDLILVGGATRMPCLQDFVGDYLQIAPQCQFNPDEVVALGAAVQAALIAEDKAVEEMVMTDVCPHTLGIEISKEFGGQRVVGYFEPIIHRNTTIPVSRESTFCTIEPNQFQVVVRVYQGEGRKVKDNLLLGELTVQGIPPGPSGTEFVVRFTYDTNGILEVEAFVPASGKRFKTVLSNHANNLTREQIASAVEKMQSIKFYPRDELENQRLLRFCERIIGEVNPMQRSNLESALDIWEHSMSSGDRDFFQNAKSGLLLVLSSLGFPYDDAQSN